MEMDNAKKNLIGSARKINALKKKAAEINEKLKEIYPDALCALEYNGEPWKLMVMGRLSAQCTDKRVNEVCLELFERFPTARSLAEGDIKEIEAIVRPCGLFHVKSSDIKGECEMLVNEYGGELPCSMEELLKFPGVGRKIANLLLGDIFHVGGIVADTHCIRICGRLGFYPEENKDPLKTEKVMSQLLPAEEQSDFCHRIVWFGREYCSAQSPKCDECPLSELCGRVKKCKKS
jgi:endonuclease-3